MESSQIEKTIVEQVVELLKRNAKNHDVTFSVGPDKIQIGAVRILLKAASVVFEKEFDENWESAVIKEGEGIPLLDVEPVAFKIFVELIISDTWSLDALRKLNLAPDTLLSLFRLCRRFKITKAIRNLEAAVNDFVQGFYLFRDTTDFLKLNRENLATILSCEHLLLDEKEVFDSACRWAEHQCSEKKIEPTGENIREVLGSAFFEIRFPTMRDAFAKVSNCRKNLLTPEERLEICEFIIMNKDDRANYDKAQLRFNTNPRNFFKGSVLQLSEFEQFKVLPDPLYVCNGSETRNEDLFLKFDSVRIKVNRLIALHGVGFLGPVDGDTQYEVTLRIERVTGAYPFSISKFKKQIVARKDRIFHFLLDEPITIEPNAHAISWNDCYRICYSLKGTNNLPQYTFSGSPDGTSVQSLGVNFHLKCFHNKTVMTELLYKIQ